MLGHVNGHADHWNAESSRLVLPHGGAPDFVSGNNIDAAGAVADENGFTSRYTVIKSSWKGKYTRVFCISPTRVATINARTISKVTNSWEYQNCLIDVVADVLSLTQFNVILHRNGKQIVMNFICSSGVERAELLTDVQRHRAAFDMRYARVAEQNVFSAQKYKSDESFHLLSLRVTPVGVEQLDADRRKVGEYLFLHVKGLSTVVGRPHSVLIMHGPQMKLHLFEVEECDRFVRVVRENARHFVGLPPYRPMNSLTQTQLDADRLGVRRDVLESAAEFAVMKSSRKHAGALVSRLLGTTRLVLVEREPTTYNTVGVYFLKSIYALVRCEADDQRLMIEFMEPHVVKQYTSPLRDALLAHLLDACRRAGNISVSIMSHCVARGRRCGSLHVPVPEEIESTFLNALVEPEKNEASISMPVTRVVAYFNANVEYGGLRLSENKEGLFSENREKLIFNALSALLYRHPATEEPAELVALFGALRRLCVSRIGFSSIAVVPALAHAVHSASHSALQVNSEAVKLAVVDFLNALMTPLHQQYELEHEIVNKNRILTTSMLVESFLEMLRDRVHLESSSLVVQSLLDFFVYALCPPFSETTEATTFKATMQALVQKVGKGLLSLLRHTCGAIRFAAGQLIRVVMEEGDADQFAAMQRAALSEGGFLMVFNTAAFDTTNRGHRDLARRLIAYWTYENVQLQDLLRRMVPMTLLSFLKSSDEPPAEEKEVATAKGVQPMADNFLESKSGWFTKSFHPRSVLPPAPPQTTESAMKTADGSTTTTTNAAVEQPSLALRSRSIRVSPTLNWDMFFYQLKQDHLRPDLIWNCTTREELRRVVEAELEAFEMGTELRREKPISWNYQEFEVVYRSLDQELKVGQHYPRLLFESAHPTIARPREFFNDLYHRFLLSLDMKNKLECLHGMSLLYKHYGEAIGQFNDLPDMVRMLDSAEEPLFRDRMLLFLSSLLHARHNVKLLVDGDGLAVLVKHVTLAHLHVDRPQIRTTSNSIESGESFQHLQEREKEWYYAQGGSKAGPVSYAALKELYAKDEVNEHVKVWAQGLPAWTEMRHVPQLHWGIARAGEPTLLSFTDVTCTILDIFLSLCAHYVSRDENGAVMQPLPKVKRFLSGPTVLPHLVQLLLTFDSAVCSRVHALLCQLMEDNPLVGRVYLTGVFYFSLMYTGSDVLPLSRFLALTHRRQSFKYPHSTNEVVQSSVLSPLLPPAMVCFLTHRGAEPFADAFLGEYDTPETIWSKEMRHYLVGKIAVHIADFTPRLLGNNTALYQYCPIVGVEYAQLTRELFCSEYYLRHLCDTARFPDWPIRDPVHFMQDLLASWRAELAKKPSQLSRAGCLEELELTDETDVSPLAVRRAYFKLAAQYHPDKNPRGREKFEKVQSAYEYLASGAAPSSEPDPHNIVLLLQSQAILFKRYGEVLKGYKYTGYGLLIPLLRVESADPEMLQKSEVLIEPAAELCLCTVNNVALNADELQEEGGIEVLSNVVSRVFELITPNSSDDDLHVRVATHCMRTLAVSAQLAECRERMEKDPSISYHSAKGVAFSRALRLSRACILSCQSASASAVLQARLIDAGALWHLLRFLFHYDSTLEEAGMDLDEAHHVQLFANRAAIFALQSIFALVGFCPGPSYLSTNRNDAVRSLLCRLLTPHIVHLMESRAGCEKEVLHLLNSNSETPVFFWNNTSRAELDELLQTNSDYCRDARLGATDLPSSVDADFVYSIHRNELIIGGVFIRLYLEQPTFSFDSPMAFFSALIEYLTKRVEERRIDADVVMVVGALNNLVLKYAGDLSSAAALATPLFVRLLAVGEARVTIPVMELLVQLMRFPNCVEALGRHDLAVVSFIHVLDSGNDDAELEKALQLLQLIVTDRSFVLQFLERGLYVFLLRLVASARVHARKEESCVCLAKAYADKLVGPKVFLRCCKFLPVVILETMKENPTQACQMLDTPHENPELVWNSERQEQFAKKIEACCRDVVKTLRDNPRACWSVPDDVVDDNSTAEIQIGGVYLALYIRQPGWSVRKPKEFLMQLLECFMQQCSAERVLQPSTSSPDSPVDGALLELITEAGLCLLSGSPSLRDYMATLGYVAKMTSLLRSADGAVVVCALRWVNAMGDSPACVEDMAVCQPVTCLLDCLQNHPAQLPLVMSTVEKLLSHSTPQANMLRLAMADHLPERLLQLLESGVATPGNMLSPAEVRAVVIKVLKTAVALRDPVYGPQLDDLLGRSTAWKKYKDQSHDLFLADTPFGTTITAGGMSGGAGAAPLSLAEAPQVAMQATEPPPLFE